jgi:biopolymer transport protein ExbD
MSIRRKAKAAPEIPLTSTADVAFLLLVFFLVAASSQRDTGKVLDLPGTVKDAPAEAGVKNLELIVRPGVYALGDELLRSDAELLAALKKGLASRTRPADRVVLVASDDAVDYQRWTNVMTAIEAAGGVPAPQMDEGDAKPAKDGEPAAAEAGAATP